MKISHKLMLSFLFFAISPCLIFFQLLQTEVIREHESGIESKIKMSLNYSRISINEYIKGRLHEVDQYSKRSFLKKSNTEIISKTLSDIIHTNSYFDEISFIDRNGIILASSNYYLGKKLTFEEKIRFDKIVKPLYTGARNQIILAECTENSNHGKFGANPGSSTSYALGAFTDVRNSKSEIIGILFSRIKTTKISNLLSELERSNGELSSVYLTNKDSKAIEINSKLKDLPPPTQLVKAALSATDSSSKAHSSVRLIRDSANGKNDIYAQTNIDKFGTNKEIGWTITVVRPNPALVDKYQHLLVKSVITILGLLILALLFGYLVSESIQKPLEKINKAAEKLASGDLKIDLEADSNTSLGRVSNSLRILRNSLKSNQDEIAETNWYTTGQITLAKEIGGVQTIEKISERAIRSLCSSLDASFGIIYLKNRSGIFDLISSFGVSNTKSDLVKNPPPKSSVGKSANSVIVQILEKDDTENTELSLEADRKEYSQVVVLPFGSSIGVTGSIKIGVTSDITDKQMKFLIHAINSIGVAIRSEKFNQAQRDLLASTQRQSKWLEIQQHELIQAKNRAETAAKSKSEFLATMSHEIRTPINGILGMTDILRTTPMSDEQADCLDTILTSGDHLMLVINDILDFSQLDRSELTLENSYFKLSDCIDEVRKIVKPMINRTNLDFSISTNTENQDLIFTDSGRLRQILINLMNNAIKFTRKGNISLTIDESETSGGKTKFVFTVKDTGIGIPKEKQKMLYQAFTQADSSDTREFGGSGLGLAICQKLSTLMDGSISLESRVNEGSKFTLEIRVPTKPSNAIDVESKTVAEPDQRYSQNSRSPIIKLVPAPVGPESPQAEDTLNSAISSKTIDGNKTDTSRPDTANFTPEKSLKDDDNLKYKILIAEDNLVNRRVAVRILELSGYDVDIAKNGEEAVKMATSNVYDIIFMDMQMPVMDGLDATRKILDLLPDDRCPSIIAMTANAMNSDRKRCMAAGMVDFMAKPIFRKPTIEMVKKWKGERAKKQKTA